jgi:hypothetical protein
MRMLPGDDVDAERQRLSELLDTLVDRLIDGIEAHPGKRWVMREHAGMELETIMDILGIESSDGLLSCYLGGL